MSYPACFDSAKQYHEWKLAARCAKPGLSGICVDCTAVYQAQMVAEGRCAFPEVEFVLTGKGAPDEELQGRIPLVVRRVVKRRM